MEDRPQNSSFSHEEPHLTIELLEIILPYCSFDCNLYYDTGLAALRQTNTRFKQVVEAELVHRVLAYPHREMASVRVEKGWDDLVSSRDGLIEKVLSVPPENLMTNREFDFLRSPETRRLLSAWGSVKLGPTEIMSDDPHDPSCSLKIALDRHTFDDGQSSRAAVLRRIRADSEEQYIEIYDSEVLIQSIFSLLITARQVIFASCDYDFYTPVRFPDDAGSYYPDDDSIHGRAAYLLIETASGERVQFSFESILLHDPVSPEARALARQE